MAKKKSKINVGKIVTLVSALLALVALLFMFAPAVKNGDSGVTYTGAQIAFGYSTTSEGLISATIKWFAFSSYFLPYVLVLAGLVFAVLAALGFLPKISKFIAAGCCIAAGVMFFLAVQMAVPAYDKLTETFRNTFALAGGAIAAGVLSLLAGVCSLCAIFIKK